MSEQPTNEKKTVLAEPIVIKERDYDFLERNRRRKWQQTSKNPLTEDRSAHKAQGKNANKNLLAQINTKLAEAGKTTTKISSEGDFVDPLSRLKFKQANPRAKPATQALPQNAPSSSAAGDGTEDISDTKQIKEQEAHLWENIRADFASIFDLNVKNLNGLVNNPFGSVGAEDKRVKQAMSSNSQGGGQNKYEFDKSTVAAKPLNQISMRGYIDNLVEMHTRMRKKWIDQDKVGTLQITIQAIKLFADNEQAKFAPIKYVYIMDILDSFSKFVYRRMQKLSFPQYTQEKLTTLTFQDISGANIPESAQEICRNWLRKVSSIRELVPRIYIEAALLPIYYFIDSTKIKQNLMKLSFQSRCIGDYINSVNFSTFILRIGAELLPREKSHILQMLEDFFYYMRQGTQFGQQGMSGEEYLKLFEPFIKTALRFYSENCSEREFQDLFELFQNSNQHSEILSRIINSFSPQLITKHSTDIFLVISSYHIDYKFKMYLDFLPKLSRGIQSSSNAPIEICNLVWLDLKTVTKLDVFLNILAPFIELINKCFKGYEKTKLFSNILEKFNELFVQVDSASAAPSQQAKSAEIFQKLEQFIKSILTNCDDIREILTIEPFLQFISFFPSQLKYDVSKEVLTMFMEREKIHKITDPIAVHAIFQIAKNLNEVDAKIVDSKAIFDLLRSFFEKIDFGKDLEQMLNLFTEIRAAFGYIPQIIDYVINRATNLTFEARALVTNPKMQKKIQGFLQACIAFCYITIPMVESPIAQFKYYVINSQVALLHNLISQSESSFKTALQILADMPETVNGKAIDEQIHEELSNLVSYMIVLPDNPENDNLHIFSGFVQILDSLRWSSKNGEVYKMSLIKDLLIYLCVQRQENFPYHIEGVRSNDKLFIDAEFRQSIQEEAANLFNKLEKIIPLIASKGFNHVDVKYMLRQTCLLINSILMYFEPNILIENVLSLLLNLIQKRCQDLNRDNLGRQVVDSFSSLFHQTLSNLEKSSKNVKDLTTMKTSIEALIEAAKKK